MNKKIKRQIDKKLENFLKKAKVKYKTIEHKLVYTAHDEAQTQKKKLNEVAKTVLVKADRALALVVVPAGKYVDLKSIKKALKAKKVSMAKEKDITKYLKLAYCTPLGSSIKSRLCWTARWPAQKK